MKTTTLFKQTSALLSLAILLIAGTGKAMAESTPTQTNWQDQDQLAGISIGTDANATDIQISIDNSTGASDTTYLVKTAKGLAWIAKVTNEEKKKGDEGATDNYPSAPGFKGCTVKLNADIDLSPHYWTPIGSTTAAAIPPRFYGTFDGNHKMIKGLKINVTKSEGGVGTGNYYAGLFGNLSTDSKVTNLGIQLAAEGVEGNSQNGDSFVGGLAGNNEGEIRNCFVIPASGKNNSSIKSTGDHNQSKQVGGLVGWNYGTIANCYTTVDVSVTHGKTQAGGIVGFNNSGNISNVYATGKVETTQASEGDCAGGIIGYFTGGKLSNALALNNVIKGGTVSGGSNFHGAGRIAGIVYDGKVATSCYASTKIRINDKVKGESEDKSSYGKRHHDDGLSADIDIDLSTLFPTTGSSDVWESNGDGNLPKLKGFDSAPQPDLALADYLDAPLNLTDTNGSLTLTFSNTDGWKYKKGSEGETSFSGRITGEGTADMTVNSTDDKPTLTFAGITLTGSTDKDALTISSGKVILASEGTSLIKAASGKVALNIADNTTCTFDNTNLFKIYGDIQTNNQGKLFGLMQWKWDNSPNFVIASWEGGQSSATIDSPYTSFATNPGGTPVTVKVDGKTQQGKLNGTGAPVSKFKFADETKAFIYYTNMENYVPKGTKDNPYLVSFADNADTNPENNNYQRVANRDIILTGSTEECYYKLIDNAPDGKTPSLTVSDNVTGTIHIISENNTFTTLKIGTNSTCTIEGTGLKPTHADVTGTLTLNAPLTMVREGIDSSDPSKYSCLYIHDGGKVTVNKTLKATAKSTITGNYYGQAIHIDGNATSGTLTIGSTGEVYGYGTNKGCYLKGQNDELNIEDGGILRLASKEEAFSSSSEKSPIIIRWNFMHAPTENQTITVKDGNSSVATFSKTDFDANFTDASSFATNVKANTDYTLWQNNTQQLTGVFDNTATQTFRTENGLATYDNVGIPLTENPSGETITLTEDGKYQIGNGSKEDFNNILSGISMESLVVDGRIDSDVILDNVTVSNKMTVNEEIRLYITNNNNISAIDIKKGGHLVIRESSGRLSNNATGLPVITNEGEFDDFTGQIQSVQIPVSSTETLTLTMTIDGNNQVEEGGTTALTAVSNLGVKTKAADYPNSTTLYQWQKWENNGWNDISNATDKTYDAGIGKYRCQMTETVTIGSGSSQQTITTGLYTSPFDVTLKSGSPDTPGGGDDAPVTPPTYYTVTLPAVEGATTDPVAGSYQVEAWDSFRFYLTLDPEYDQSQPVVTTSRQETLTPRTSDGAYIATYVRNDFEIRIDSIKRNSPVANEAIHVDAATVRRTGNRLLITSPRPADIRIYSFTGALLDAARLSTASSITRPAPREACIVVVGNQRFKVLGDN